MRPLTRPIRMAYDMKPTMDQMPTSTAAITPHVAVNRSLSNTAGP
jgi:hypothetical protein